MVKRSLLGLAVVLVGIATVVLIRTTQLSYEPSGVNPVERPDFDADGAVDRLSEAIQLPTISLQDTADMDHAAFERFLGFMKASYPRGHETLRRERVGSNGYTLLYRWEGRDTTQSPIMLMGHYDVVPVEERTEDEWSHAPFGGTQADGYLWGRGAPDDKSGTLSAFEAIEHLLKTGYQAEQTVYIAANHD